MRKQVVGWEGFYEVSDAGEVFSVDRVVERSNRTSQAFAGRALTPSKSDKGYLVVRLSAPGRRKTARVHRLVAEAFIHNPDSLPEVNHIDGVKSNPCADNLEWVTPSGNRLHAVHVLKTVMPPRTRDLSPTQVQAIKRDYQYGVNGHKRVAKAHGVSPSTVRGIVHGEIYKNLAKDTE